MKNAMPFTIKHATTTDAAAITKIFLSDSSRSFLQLQMGTVDPVVLNEGMLERIAESIQKPDQEYLVAQDDETSEIVSFSQWLLPRDEMEAIVGKGPGVSVVN